MISMPIGRARSRARVTDPTSTASASIRHTAKLVVVALIAGLLTVMGVSAPALAAGSVNVTIVPSGETYDGTQVFEAGTDYTLNVQYGKMANGQQVRITAPAGVTIPDSSLVVPPGNTAVSSLTRDGADIVLTFANPFPSSIDQGLLGLKFRFDTVTESVKTDVPWKVDGTPLTSTVIIKKPGDQFENVTPGASKNADGSAFDAISSKISVTNGQVAIDPSAASTPITYAVHAETAAAAPGFTITDTLGSYLELVGGTGSATLTTWDASGLNKTTTTLAAPAVTDGATSLTFTTDLPANSVLDVTYQARIDSAQLGALRDALQAKYDAVKTTGGDWKIALSNSAVIGSFGTKTATGQVGGNVAGPWTPDLWAFSKYGWLTDGPDSQWVTTSSTSAPYVFDSPVKVMWALNANLSQWDGSTPERTLGQNVVITDQLPTGQAWNTADASFIQLINASSGATLPLTAAPAGTTAAQMSGGAFVDQYLVDGDTLVVNIGTAARNLRLQAKAIISSVDYRWNSTAEMQSYLAANTASFDWSTTEDAVSRNAGVYLTGKPTGPVPNDAFFTKSTSDQTVEVTSGEAAWVPYQFNVGSAPGKISETTIVDHIDHSVFDVTSANLEEIRATISGYFNANGRDFYSNIAWSTGLDSSDFALSLNADGDLVIQPSQELLDFLTNNPWSDTQGWRVALKLPTKKIDGTQTIQVRNDASLLGSKHGIEFISKTESYATTWGDELEVRKSVWDAANSQWTTSVRVPLNDDGSMTQDTFTYKVQAMPHGDYANVTIIPIADVLPAGVDFVGFADSATSGTSTTTKLLPGNLQASYDSASRTITIKNQDGTLLTKQQSIDTYIRVKVTSFTADTGITNVVSGNPATIVPTNDYPLNVLKKDATNPTKAITDANAQFEVKDSDGALVATAQVKDGVLVVSDGQGGTKALTVKKPGSYTITEKKAPAGYTPTTEVFTAVANTDGSSPQVVITNEPIVDYAVGDRVWIDANRDGLQSEGEPSLEGVQVDLLDSAGAVVKTTSTDANGLYLFDNLVAGDYRVRFTLTDAQAEMYDFTTANASGTSPASTPDATDSDAVVSADPKVATTPVFTLAASNPALTKSYTDQTVTATEGIDPTWDAGVVVNKVSIGDYAWWDVNRDGLQTAGEPVVPNLPVSLTLDGTVVATTTTDANGYYAFANLLPSTEYVVTFSTPTGTVNDAAVFFTTQNAGGDASNSKTADLTDSDADPANGTVTVTTPDAGFNLTAPGQADNPGIDAGFVQYNLSLKKTLDTAGPFAPGQQVTYTLTPHNDGPVAALAGWSVTDVLPAQLTLVSITGEGYTCDPATATCVATEALGAGVDGATITVVATIGAIFSGVAKNVAYVSPSKDDVAETNPLTKPTLSTDTSATTTDNDAQAQLEVPKVSIGDYVWWDVDRDGTQNDDKPAAGVTVNLLLNGAQVATTATDADGYYWFTDLLPSTQYTVQFVKPEGTTFTTQNATSATDNSPSTDLTDSDANPVDGTVTFTTPATGSNLPGARKTDNPGIDAGLVKYNLKLTKTRTTTETVYKGDTVTFTLTPSNDGPVDALTGWSVTEVLPAELTLVSIAGDGYDIAGATATSRTVLKAGATGNPITVTATVNQNLSGDVKNVAYVSPAPTDAVETNPLGTPPTNTTDTATSPTDNDAEAPVKGASLVSIGDYVWIDVNRDGVQNDGNPVKDVTVNLYKADGTTLIATTKTNAQGFYSFGDLRPSTDVVVEFVKPDGYSFTKQNAGESDRSDSDADVATGRVNVTTPASGGNSLTAPDDPTIDAGLVKFNLTLTKAITSSGPYYEGSTVTFTLTPHNDGPAAALKDWSVVELPQTGLTITALDGGEVYRCDVSLLTCVSRGGLPAGTDGAPITVTAVIAENFVGELNNVAYVVPATTDVPETNPLQRPENALVDTSATPTDNDDSKRITVDSLVSVGDYVWWDNDRDGVQGEDEPPVSDVTVNLRDAEGTLLRSTTTDDNGYYAFDDLVPGRDYVIEFVKPDGTSFTTQNSGEGDALDSDADVTTGRVSITAPASGTNRTEPGEADDPTIDAGLVEYDLTVTKVRLGDETVESGKTVTFTLTPHNDGPSDVLAGWTVADQLPTGLTLVSITGEGYTCADGTCTASDVLAAGQDGEPITVIAKVGAGVTGTLLNVAVVAPSATDVPEKNPNNNTDDAPVKAVAPPLAVTGGSAWVWGTVGGIALGLLLLGLVLLIVRRGARAR